MTKNNDNASPNTPDGVSSAGFIKGNTYMLIAALFWGVNISVTKDLLPEWMNPEQLSAIRILGGCILFWLTSMFIKCDRISHSDWPKLIVGGLVGIGGFLYLFIISLRYANPIDVSIIMTLPPAFVMLIGAIFLHRKVSLLEWIGVAVSFAGAATVILAGSSGKSGSDNVLGDVLAIASTICFAIYLVIIEKPSKTYNSVTLLRWVFLFGSVPAIFFIGGLPYMHIVKAPAFVPWAEVAFILLCPTFLAYFLTNPAEKLIGSELTSLYQYLVPVFATVSAVMMGLDRLHPAQIIAMAIIIAGMVLTNMGKRRKARSLQTESSK